MTCGRRGNDLKKPHARVRGERGMVDLFNDLIVAERTGVVPR